MRGALEFSAAFILFNITFMTVSWYKKWIGRTKIVLKYVSDCIKIPILLLLEMYSRIAIHLLTDLMCSTTAGLMITMEMKDMSAGWTLTCGGWILMMATMVMVMETVMSSITLKDFHTRTVSFWLITYIPPSAVSKLSFAYHTTAVGSYSSSQLSSKINVRLFLYKVINCLR